jgi:antagonist of KipI
MGGIGEAMSAEILRPGLLTTIQDLGRPGWQKYGIVAGGALDPVALRIANLLVGNPENEAGLEITGTGLMLQFHQNARIAVCGGALSPMVDGKPLPCWRPVAVRKGSVLAFHAPCEGYRAYLAVAGGFDVPPFLGSRSTYLHARVGGFRGRALQVGDVLPFRAPAPVPLGQETEANGEDSDKIPFVAARWRICTEALVAGPGRAMVRVMRGPQWDWFAPQARYRFFTEAFRVMPQSDRMGCRLEGPPLERSVTAEMISEAVTAGSVQVPPDGRPIVLLADRPTTGGYPKIAQVATVDLPLLAQWRPGMEVRFQEIGLKEAQRLYVERERRLRQLAVAVRIRAQRGGWYVSRGFKL